ncbi:E3 ubiquitin-protein ligase RNF34 [Phymastichus coffea]|uniref:E3 ubiquitin-protein ligase RNF34 n=1 Tax=Phymastichus coffea TaxID=108790 RepID=UPI00273B7AE2|nr:E3 ubiquitin-protein ligase RNF34 [Phymastichus coffea]
MACEACAIKFTIFKRKKQCMDCLRYFCTECVIRRFDRILSCDNCSMLSRRPLIKSQVLKMSSKYLRQYLIAKKVSIRGCIEKEDLVNLLIIFANGTDPRSNERLENTPHNPPRENRTDPISHNQQTINPMESAPQNQDENTLQNSGTESNNELESNQATILNDSPTRRSRSPQVIDRPPEVSEVTTPEEVQEASAVSVEHNVEIIEVLENDDNVNGGPEPVITEQEEVQEMPPVEHTEMFTEIHTWTGIVKLADIKEAAVLESLTVKQLKDLLSANRVDYKGCVERCELLARASRLWEEYQRSRTGIETADEDVLCKICLDAPIECVILECGHMACCINCGKQMSECPICRQYVVRVVRFFKA